MGIFRWKIPIFLQLFNCPFIWMYNVSVCFENQFLPIFPTIITKKETFWSKSTRSTSRPAVNTKEKTTKLQPPILIIKIYYYYIKLLLKKLLLFSVFWFCIQVIFIITLCSILFKKHTKNRHDTYIHNHKKTTKIIDIRTFDLSFIIWLFCQ